MEISKSEAGKKSKLEKTSGKISKEISKIGGNLVKIEEVGVPKDIDKRLRKIIQTNQPSYIFGMRKVLSALENTCHQSPHAAALDFKSQMDAIAKLGLGDGRYLHMVHPEEMSQINTSSKALLTLSEELNQEISPGEIESAIRKANDEYEAIARLTDEQDTVARDISSLKIEKTNSIKKKASEDERLKKIRADINSSDVSALNNEIKSKKTQLQNMYDSVHFSVAGISRGLRKYSHIAVSEEKLIQSLISEPLDTFLKTEHKMIASVLDGFMKNMAEIKLKDSEKIIQKAFDAKETLTKEFRDRIISLKGDISRLEKRRDGLEIYSLEREAVKSIDEIRRRVSELDRELRKKEAEESRIGDEMKKLEEDLENCIEKAGFIIV
jgi:hypothetical protein